MSIEVFVRGEHDVVAELGWVKEPSVWYVYYVNTKQSCNQLGEVDFIYLNDIATWSIQETLYF